ncbi:MAG: DUF1576 domain-containing protein [Tissierellia bacterium]|nr:DUF1576 domain-containing protein [Tissierellia bacterium]
MAKKKFDFTSGSKIKYRLMYAFCAYLIVAALIFNSPKEILNGLKIITTASDNLITDYMELANIGAALFNSAILTMIHLSVMKYLKVNLDSLNIAALLTVTGFALFGKNFINYIPLSLGVYLYSFIKKEDLKTNVNTALFINALGPMVTEIYYIVGGIEGIFVAMLVGLFVGVVFTPLAESFKAFHHGFSLYNAGFTAGIIAMLFNGFLRSIDIYIVDKNIILKGHNRELFIMLFILQAIIIVTGYFSDEKAFKNYKRLILTSGVNQPKYTDLFGIGATLINCGTMGLFATCYVILVGGQLNGPTIGGILTIMGFAFVGKNIKNAIPIFVGVYLASALNIYNAHQTGPMLAALFGTTLCPISGYYGIIPGIIVGFLHMGLVTNVGGLNSGLNLYNNGFSGGFIAAVAVPILNAFYPVFGLEIEEKYYDD